MSKTKGNVMDPLDLVAQYGADAVRFTLASLASPGRDLPLDAKRMEGYRSFGTKLWNAARFVQMHLTGDEPTLADIDRHSLAAPESWIVSRLAGTIADVNRAWETFRFDEGCRALYQFVWNDYCDWYLEMAKPLLLADGEPADRGVRTAGVPQGQADAGRKPEQVRAVARGVLLEALTLLHPAMPFISEEIAEHLGAPGPLITSRYPGADRFQRDAAAEGVLAAFQGIVGEVRSYRHLVGLPPSASLALHLVDVEPGLAAALSALDRELVRLAGLSAVTVNPARVPAGAVRDLAGGVHIAIELAGSVLGPAERKRLTDDLSHAQRELLQVSSRLADESFVQRAPAEVVEGARARAGELAHKAELLRSTLG
jgi:valyl-tRNA synthetase